MLLSDGVYPATCDADIGHVVVTRYNVRAHREQRGLEDAEKYRTWLEDRAHQFATVCLPSLLQQKKRPDGWFIAFDGTDREAVADIVGMLEEHPWITPVWQEEGDHQLLPLRRALSRMANRFDYIASTRLDNDDAIALNYISDADTYARAVLANRDLDDFWIAFTHGVQRVEDRFFSYMHAQPHFLTRVRRGGLADGQFVMGLNHTKLRTDPDREVVLPSTRFPMWLENVHGQNVLNRQIKGLLELSPAASVAARFGLDLG
ncbi:MAG TPA: glycosyltransferase [Propionibacteriaceae bacterium]|nr:glycosyltransferase [Propionibacteriaceae bacterium]